MGDVSTRGVGGILVIGGAAGFFSAVFGVGGGIVVVPLLILLRGHDTRAATATSLAAIVLTAAWGTVAHGALGNVDWMRAALIGVPAMLGVTLGVYLKQALSSRALSYAFAVFLVAVAIVTAVGS